MPFNLYATDGKCHNANHGTYGHECGRPAEWIGHKADGFASGFCSKCKAEGDEARPIVRWEPIELKSTRKTTAQAQGWQVRQRPPRRTSW